MSADSDFDARKFDSVIYRLIDVYLNDDRQLAGFIVLVKNAATALLKQTSNPQVAVKKEFLQSVISETYWKNVTVHRLENLREEMRALMKFIEKDSQVKFYTDFADELTGEIEEVDIIGSIVGLETYNQRVASFIRKHANYIAISKIKNNEPISSEELEQLKQLLFTEDPDAAKHLDEVLGDKDLTQFIRTVISLDAKAAKALFADFINREGINAQQINFIDTLINFLTINGSLSKEMLFDRPYTDINQNGVVGVFKDDTRKILSIIDRFNQTSHTA